MGIVSLAGVVFAARQCTPHHRLRLKSMSTSHNPFAYKKGPKGISAPARHTQIVQSPNRPLCESVLFDCARLEQLRDSLSRQKFQMGDKYCVYVPKTMIICEF
jgi:hypothetical protein